MLRCRPDLQNTKISITSLVQVFMALCTPVHNVLKCRRASSSLHDTITMCKVGAEVAPPVLAKVVEAQRIDGEYRSIWIVHSAFIPQIK